jgi:RNA polymerase sigma factor (sigma-70 family)
MATSPMNPVIDQLRRAALLGDGPVPSDGQLLESFVGRNDEAAFEVLVRRHGPMVLGVCRRVLRNHHDAEDAFQATFLVLARKAGSVVPPERLANWLYGVAYRTALKARGMLARRRARERQVAQMPEPEAVAPAEGSGELRPLLDRELNRLPDKYRAPVVLCDLEGQTGKEAARLLGWPEGTVSSRLARGRALLARRLSPQGLSLSGASLVVVLSRDAAHAGVPASLVSSTARAAGLLAAGRPLAAGVVPAGVAALTKGGLTAMLLPRLKTPAAVLLALGFLCAGLGASAFIYQTRAEGPASAEAGRLQAKSAPACTGPAGQVPPGAGEEGRGREGRCTKEPGRRRPEHGAERVPGVPRFQGTRERQGRRTAEGGRAGPVRRSLPSGVSDFQRDREGDGERPGEDEA